VGHSQGGLIGAWYVKKLGGWRRVRALVTLGTPHQGTRAAWAGLPLMPLAPALWQMTPGSGFVRRLQGGAWPPGVRLTSIWSRGDRLAPPPAALVASGGLDYVRNVEVAAEGHRDFLHRKPIYELLLRELRDGDQAAPVRLSGLARARAEQAAVRAERQAEEALQAG
jgi:pimeloyl-ACP methyl ester carboxylesterase